MEQRFKYGDRVFQQNARQHLIEVGVFSRYTENLSEVMVIMPLDGGLSIEAACSESSLLTLEEVETNVN